MVKKLGRNKFRLLFHRGVQMIINMRGSRTMTFNLDLYPQGYLVTLPISWIKLICGTNINHGGQGDALILLDVSIES